MYFITKLRKVSTSWHFFIIGDIIYDCQAWYLFTYEELLDYKKLGQFIRSKINENEQFYIFLDEVQFCKNFEKVLNGLNRNDNLDIYVTGSNSKFLSTDILTEFRGWGDEIRVYPLSFSEYYYVEFSVAFNDYLIYGGLREYSH